MPISSMFLEVSPDKIINVYKIRRVYVRGNQVVIEQVCNNTDYLPLYELSRVREHLRGVPSNSPVEPFMELGVGQ